MPFGLVGWMIGSSSCSILVDANDLVGWMINNCAVGLIVGRDDGLVCAGTLRHTLVRKYNGIERNNVHQFIATPNIRFRC